MSGIERGGTPAWICKSCPMIEECSTNVLKACPQDFAAKGLKIKTKSQTPSLEKELQKNKRFASKKIEEIQKQKEGAENYLETLEIPQESQNTHHSHSPSERKSRTPSSRDVSKKVRKEPSPKQVKKRVTQRRRGGPNKLITVGLLGSLAVGTFLSKATDIKADEIFDTAIGRQPEVPTYPDHTITEAPKSIIPDIFSQHEYINGRPLASYFYEVPVGDWEEKIVFYSSQHSNIDANMLASLLTIESCGNQGALSYTGAIGLGQLMQSTFPEYTREQLYDPDTNLMLTAQYLSQQVAASRGNVQAAFAGYNGGPFATKWQLGESWTYKGQFLSGREGYKQTLLLVGGYWNSHERVEGKAKEVERMVELSYLYNDAVSGSRATFDMMQAQGRCVR